MNRKREFDAGDAGAGNPQRLDKWLWFARIVRTRAAAAELAASGHVRINGQRANAASRGVKTGDVLTIALDRRVLVLKVLDSAERRGTYSKAKLLYEDLASPAGDELAAPDGASLRH